MTLGVPGHRFMPGTCACRGPIEQPSLRQAAEELQRYLSDEIAPMMVVEYFEQLVPSRRSSPPRSSGSGSSSQHSRPAENVATADLIFHALEEALAPLRARARPSRDDAPRHPRHQPDAPARLPGDGTRRAPDPLEPSRRVRDGAHFARASSSHRAAGCAGRAVAAAAPAAPTTESKPAAASAEPKPDPETMDRGAEALSLLLGELAKLRKPDAPPEKEGPEAAMLAQVLATAALESKTNEDLARHLERVKQEGVATPMGQVFRTLGWSLPGWGTIGEEDRPSTPARAGSSRRWIAIVALAPDAQERAKRWGEMIYAAIEQLNEGRLAQAVSILEVAKRLIIERRPDAEIVAQVLAQAEAAISDDVLRRLADVPAKHGLLRKALEFFPR